MKYVFVTGFLAVLWAYINMYQLEVTLFDIGMDKVEYAVENAAHDAALQVDEDMIANNKVLFVKSKADKTFRETMMANLKIDQDLKPIHSTILEQPIKLLDVQYIDNSYINPLTSKLVTYPFIYQYRGDKRLERTVFGPSIVYVIETTFYKSEEPHQFVVIQEYKK